MIEAVGASSVYRYLASQPLAPRDVLKNTSCHRAAADVSHADEQDTDHARDSIAVCDDIDPSKPWLYERLPKLFRISIVRR
jgi:hypothetical protein